MVFGVFFSQERWGEFLVQICFIVVLRRQVVQSCKLLRPQNVDCKKTPWWVDPVQHLTLSSRSLIFPPSECGENQKSKARKIVSQDKYSLTGETKFCMWRKTYWLLPISLQMFSCFLKRRASAHIRVTWKGKNNNSENPLFLFLSLSLSFYYWPWHHMVRYIPSVS